MKQHELMADYTGTEVTQDKARQLLEQASEFVETIKRDFGNGDQQPHD